VHVSAKDQATGKEQKIRIESSSGMSNEEIDRMVKEGQQFAEEDKKRMEEIQSKNALDSLIYTSEKTLKDHGGKISAEEKKKVEDALKEGKEALKSGDATRMNKAAENITTASHTLAQKMYEEAAKQQGASSSSTSGASGESAQGGGKSSSANKENVVDADYEVVDEEKKDKK